MRKLTQFEANLVAKLLEDRAAQCTRNSLACIELEASPTAHYWNEQYQIAADLAKLFREEGK